MYFITDFFLRYRVSITVFVIVNEKIENFSNEIWIDTVAKRTSNSGDIAVDIIWHEIKTNTRSPFVLVTFT